VLNEGQEKANGERYYLWTEDNREYGALFVDSDGFCIATSSPRNLVLDRMAAFAISAQKMYGCGEFEFDHVVRTIQQVLNGEKADLADVELDMSQVSYMSSAGLRMMLLLYLQAAGRDSKIALVGLSEEIEDTMSATGFLDYFTTRDTVEAGLEALR
jgi:anti-sigma B factor antagonist